MTKNNNIYLLGNIAIDISFKDQKPTNAIIGGSASNACISLSRLGVNCSLVTEIGDDDIGSLILKSLSEEKADTKFVNICKGKRSTIIIAMLDNKGEASYTIYDDKSLPCAISPKLSINKNDILFYSGYFSVDKRQHHIIKAIVERAKDNGAITIFDPNIRRSINLQDPETRKHLEVNIKNATIVRGSDQDFKVLCNANSSDEAWAYVQSLGVQYFIYTQNKDDVYFYTNEYILKEKVPEIETATTIGAGDNFDAGICSTVSTLIQHKSIEQFSQEDWKKVIHNGILLSSIVCQTKENYLPKDQIKQIKNLLQA
ncbi:MAG: carbohydrate kinase family protein [Hyphomicrobiales bacterium]